MQRVKTAHQVSNGEAKYTCECTPSCHFITYDMHYGSSSWPADGPELQASYDKIVQHKVMPYLSKQNTSLADISLDYFSNVKDRRNIMRRNFARVTVYIKDLTVSKTEQVAAYSELDLLSDIGMYHGGAL